MGGDTWVRLLEVSWSFRLREDPGARVFCSLAVTVLEHLDGGEGSPWDNWRRWDD